MKLNRKILKIGGADRARFLDDILSIPIFEDMPLRYGALLSPQGKILSDVFVFSENNFINLDLPISEYEAVKSRLQLYKLRADVTFEEDERIVSQDKGTGDPRGSVGQRVYGETTSWDEKNYLQARIEACVPEFGIDFEANQAYPREWRFDEMGGVNYKKGCFVGQEIIARMRHKSELLKSVMRVQGNENLEKDSIVLANDKEVGKLLSVHQNQGLAFLRLKNLDQDQLNVNGKKLTLDEPF